MLLFKARELASIPSHVRAGNAESKNLGPVRKLTFSERFLPFFQRFALFSLYCTFQLIGSKVRVLAVEVAYYLCLCDTLNTGAAVRVMCTKN